MDDRQSAAADRPGAAHGVAASGLAAVVLAGGAGRRLGGLDKSSLMVGGRSLLVAVVSAAFAAGVSRVVVVGPERADVAGAGVAGAGAGVGVCFTSEEPPGSGPVPALRAGLELVREPWVLLLAGDLPFLNGMVLSRLAKLAESAGGAVLVDDERRAQWLTSCWGMAGLRAALAVYAGNSLRRVLSGLPYVEVAAGPTGAPPCWLDCDTPEDLAAARALASRLA